MYFGDIRTIEYDIRAELTKNGSALCTLTASDISSYDVTDSASSFGVPVGTAASKSFTLTFNNQLATTQFSASELDGVKVVVKLYDSRFTQCVRNNVNTWLPFGVWYIDSADASEQDCFITVRGSDVLSSKAMNTPINDTLSYPRTLKQLVQSLVADIVESIATPNFHGNSLSIATKPSWEDGTTIRDVLAMAAVIAGGYCRINYAGQLEIRTLDEIEHTISYHHYSEFSGFGGSDFNFNALEYKAPKAEDFRRFAIDASIEDNATNTLQAQNNPIIGTTDSICNDIVSTLNGVSYEGANLTWFASCAVQAGDTVTITDLSDTEHAVIATTCRLLFDGGGLSGNLESAMPSIESQNASSYSTGTSVFNADGSINYKAIRDIDTCVVQINNEWIARTPVPWVESDDIEIKDGVINIGSTGELNLAANSVLNIYNAAGGNAIILNKDGITLGTGATFEVYSNNFEIDEDGNVTLVGTITATDGSIGGWSLAENALYSGTGTSYVALSSNPSASYAMWAGAETAENAPFRVRRDGTVDMTKLEFTDKDGHVVSTLNLRTNMWKLNRAVQTLEVDTSTNTLTIELYDGTEVNFSKAAGSISISGAWSNNTYTATATCGESTDSVSTTLGGIVGTNVGYTVASGGTVFLTANLGVYDNNSELIGTLTAGGTGTDSTIVITSVYNSIRNSALSGVTLSKRLADGTITVTNSANANTVTATISQITASASATYNTSTGRYLVSIPLSDGTTPIGTSATYSFEATEAYNAGHDAGYTDGYTDGYDDGYAAGWAAAKAVCSSTRSGNVISVVLPSDTPDVAATPITYTITAYVDPVTGRWTSVSQVVASAKGYAQVNNTTVKTYTRQTTLTK